MPDERIEQARVAAVETGREFGGVVRAVGREMHDSGRHPFSYTDDAAKRRTRVTRSAPDAAVLKRQDAAQHLYK